MIRIRYPRCP